MMKSDRGSQDTEIPAECSNPITVGGDNQAETNEWIRFGMRLAVNASLHPFEYAKVLIQLGYEPLAPTLGKSIFGKPALILPNVFQYIGHIRRVDGLLGCYRGLTPKLIGAILSLLGSERIAGHLGFTPYKEKNDECDHSDEEFYMQFKTNLKRDVILTTSGIIISHPFHVISVRMMAQFIGHESFYDTVVSSIAEIYKNEGLKGFFAGLVPKLLCDVACVILTSSTVFLLNKHFIKDKIGRHYNAGCTQFVFASLLYPLQVVSTCMAVTGARLMAGRPPVMPEYRNWMDCFNDLQARGGFKRGTSLFWRTIAVPQTHRNPYLNLQ